MLKYFIWTVAVVCIALLLPPLVVIYFLNNGNPIHEYLTDKYIPAYLEEQGYSDDELASSHSVYPNISINKDFYHGHYMVKFKDEPEFTYFYGLTKKGKEVKQFCERNWIYSTQKPTNYYDKKNKSKHLENDCVYLYDNQ
ncbi:DUF3139 domain-containing protein [Bacillus mesophilum]|uniref:DUF3139 domain-containing protein n=1 Tax=Bacillus mesophilum TaxID=1071718 RepID=A0A7V7RJU6_9BACI|nr:DUF3139 domain-containing protein [Bacillus mesophilum]KAB2331328.1 DUF3139 domain-containing protein [Bacillus mesophilum]